MKAASLEWPGGGAVPVWSAVTSAGLSFAQLPLFITAAGRHNIDKGLRRLAAEILCDAYEVCHVSRGYVVRRGDGARCPLLLGFSLASPRLTPPPRHTITGAAGLFGGSQPTCAASPLSTTPARGWLFPENPPPSGLLRKPRAGQGGALCPRESKFTGPPTTQRVCKSCLPWDVLSRLRDRTRGLLGCTRGCWSSEAFCPRVAVAGGYRVLNSYYVILEWSVPCTWRIEDVAVGGGV